MSRVKQETQGNDVNAAVGSGSAREIRTRRSWLAGVGALFAANAMSFTTAPAARAGGEPLSPWPYQTPGVRFLLQARVTIGPLIDIGATAYGHRRIIPITGGTFHGPRLTGAVLDQGEDTQLVRLDGVTEIAARYTLRTRDEVLIHVTNCGVIVPDERNDATGSAQSASRVPRYVRTIPQLEAPRDSGYEWLNQALYVGTLNPLPPAEHAVIVRFFEVI